jgi:transcriptional regulator with XRE-family HTH domain
MDTTYTTLTGRRFDLAQLSADERGFLSDVLALFQRQPRWEAFSRAWLALGRERLWHDATMPVGSPVYRICQDLATRLGVREGRVARPDYRDRLVDLIEERYGSRYRFCKETGIDPGHLSRVLAGKKHFAAETLFRILDALGAELTIIDRAQADQLPPAVALAR